MGNYIAIALLAVLAVTSYGLYNLAGNAVDKATSKAITAVREEMKPEIDLIKDSTKLGLNIASREVSKTWAEAKGQRMEMLGNAYRNFNKKD